MWNKHRNTPAETDAELDAAAIAADRADRHVGHAARTAAAHYHADRLLATPAARDAEAAATGAAGDYAIEDADSADDDRKAVWWLLGL